MRLPLVGDSATCPGQACKAKTKTKTKTFLRREKQRKFVGFACLPLVGPGGFDTPSERRLSAGSLLSRFQAHPSMRKCSYPPSCYRPGQRLTAIAHAPEA